MHNSLHDAKVNREYNVLSIFEQQQQSASFNSLIILNQSIRPLSVFKRAWDSAIHRVCADGAANRLFDDLSNAHTASVNSVQQKLHVEDFIPDAIVGDLDSIRPEVKQWYAARGVAILHDGDQYSTDFAKALKHVYQLAEARHQQYTKQQQQQRQDAQSEDADDGVSGVDVNMHNVVVLGSLAGRVDQGIGMLHELYRESRRFVDGAPPLLGAVDFKETTTSEDSSLPPQQKQQQQQQQQQKQQQQQQQNEFSSPSSTFMERRRLWLVSEQALSLCLAPGTSTLRGIHVRGQHSDAQRHDDSNDDAVTAQDHPDRTTQPSNDDDEIFAKHCGLLPVFGPLTITTTGLEWDVTNWATEMGGRVSSSNHVVSDTVTVESDGWLLFTVAFDSSFLDG